MLDLWQIASEVEVEAAKGGPCTADLCQELSSCYLSCTPAAEEEDNDVIYYIDGVH